MVLSRFFPSFAARSPMEGCGKGKNRQMHPEHALFIIAAYPMATLMNSFTLHCQYTDLLATITGPLWSARSRFGHPPCYQTCDLLCFLLVGMLLSVADWGAGGGWCEGSRRVDWGRGLTRSTLWIVALNLPPEAMLCYWFFMLHIPPEVMPINEHPSVHTQSLHGIVIAIAPLPLFVRNKAKWRKDTTYYGYRYDSFSWDETCQSF